MEFQSRKTRLTNGSAFQDTRKQAPLIEGLSRGLRRESQVRLDEEAFRAL